MQVDVEDSVWRVRINIPAGMAHSALRPHSRPESLPYFVIQS